jgi:hypothetical protein
MLPLLKFYFHEEVRQAAVQSLPDLLRSAFLAAQKGLPGADADYVRRMVDFIWTPLMEAMAKVCAYQGLACKWLVNSFPMVHQQSLVGTIGYQ